VVDESSFEKVVVVLLSHDIGCTCAEGIIGRRRCLNFDSKRTDVVKPISRHEDVNTLDETPLLLVNSEVVLPSSSGSPFSGSVFSF
jgi:hypothetical protein